jgi:NAD(P)-dependent dehydrogenase (short-subunit alcohol dehydrogenase family)
MTRTVLVTGASSGIGRAAALALSQRGFTVYAGARGPLDYEGVTRVELDVTNPDHVEALRELPIDGLVNNAGIAVIGPLEYLPLDELRRQFEVNTIGQLAVTQACLPALRQARGRIVNVSSIAGRVALPLYGPYSASKFALEAVNDTLRRELRGRWRFRRSHRELEQGTRMDTFAFFGAFLADVRSEIERYLDETAGNGPVPLPAAIDDLRTTLTTYH